MTVHWIRTGAAVTLVALVVLPGPGASALSCVSPPPNLVPAATLARSGDFSDRFDGAVVGVVSRVSGDPVPVVEVDVEQSVGDPLRGRTRFEGSHWAPVRAGERYFIPYRGRDAVRRVLLCRDTPQLVPATFRLVPPSAQVPVATAPAPDRDDLPVGWLIGGGLAACVAVAVWAGLRRRHAVRADGEADG